MVTPNASAFSDNLAGEVFDGGVIVIPLFLSGRPAAFNKLADDDNPDYRDKLNRKPIIYAP